MMMNVSEMRGLKVAILMILVTFFAPVTISGDALPNASVRALVQAADYSAYGVPSSRYGSFSSDNRLHLGLEWQPMKGIYGYYNNARFRDAILAGSFYQRDPLAEKYLP